MNGMVVAWAMIAALWILTGLLLFPWERKAVHTDVSRETLGGE